MSTSVTPDYIMQLGLGFWASKALLSAVELDLFTELARRPATAGDVVERLGLHPRGARDFLDALVALKVLDYTGEDCRGWMREAGFRETRVEHLAGPDSMVVGIK